MIRGWLVRLLARWLLIRCHWLGFKNGSGWWRLPLDSGQFGYSYGTLLLHVNHSQ